MTGLSGLLSEIESHRNCSNIAWSTTNLQYSVALADLVKAILPTSFGVTSLAFVAAVYLTVSVKQTMTNKGKYIIIPQIAKFMGPTWDPLGPVGPRWAPCWPHELCYQGWHGSASNYATTKHNKVQQNNLHTRCIIRRLLSVMYGINRWPLDFPDTNCQ